MAHCAAVAKGVPKAKSADDIAHSLTPNPPGVTASALPIIAKGNAAASRQTGISTGTAAALVAAIATRIAKRSSDRANRRRVTAGCSNRERSRSQERQR